MKILAVYPYVPYPLNRGAYYRAFHLLKGLAQQHSVDLLALSENGEGEEHEHIFSEFCDKVRTVRFAHPAWQKLFPKRLLNPTPSTIAHWTLPQLSRKIDEILSETHYDAVHICDIVLVQYFLKKHRDLPLVVDRTRVDLFYQIMEHQNLKFPLKARLLNYENYVKLWWYERKVANRARAEVVCGPDDADFVHRFIHRECQVSTLPNGVDLAYFTPKGTPRDTEPTILFCGAMDYNPNIDALRWYFGSMHEDLRKSVPQLKVLIVGKDPVREVQDYRELPGVTVTGGVPDVRPFYERAWLQIVPLRIGGGTRLKIVESLAMRTPVVSTTIGAQGLSLRHGEDILLADNPSSFVNQTAGALQDASLREKLQVSGLRSVQERLCWSMLGRQLCDLYRQLFPRLQGSSSVNAHGVRPAVPERDFV